MSIDQDILRQLMASFREELSERMAGINAGLLAPEQGGAAEQQATVLEELFRHVHSLKGAARAVELHSVEKLAHGIEDVFGAAKRDTIRIGAPLFDLLYQGLDLIGAIVSSVEVGEGPDPALDISGYLVRLAQAWRSQPIDPPETGMDEIPALPQQEVLTPVKPTAQPSNGETIRVPTARLDELMAQVGELLVTRLRTTRRVAEVRELHTLTTTWQRDWQQPQEPLTASSRKAGDGGDAQLRVFLSQGAERLQTLTDRLGQLARRLTDDVNRLSLVSDELQYGLKQARLLPLATLVDAFRRMVRDLAREKGVEVTLDVRGADTEIDKHVLEQIKDPVMHLLRNCIDHGIEAPEAREAAGKPRRGTITLSAERLGNDVVVEVIDDGAGIDTEAVRAAAVRRGLFTKDAVAGMSEREVTALVLTAGLSTSPLVTELSGRGIGLDVVRRNVESLHGRVETHSHRGKDTTLALTLPLTLVSTHCMLVRVAGQVYAVPLSVVERMTAVGREDITSVQGQEAISYQGRPISLMHVTDVLRLPERGQPLNGHKLPAIILAAEGQCIAFLVDELVDEQEVVVKGLGPQLSRVPNVAGAAVLGSGEIALILNGSDLVRSAQGATATRVLSAQRQQSLPQKRKTILVVDDSITTRTLEKNILTTAAGYEVRLATDGQEALAVLQENNCDLVVCDLDMPRMDGFELTRRVKQDERCEDLPVILVTSLDSPEYKARGIEVGADAYIVKSTFDQDHLLETIRQLI